MRCVSKLEATNIGIGIISVVVVSNFAVIRLHMILPVLLYVCFVASSLIVPFLAYTASIYFTLAREKSEEFVELWKRCAVKHGLCKRT